MSADLGACVEVDATGRVRWESGQLRAQRVHGSAGRPRVALIQAGALLLGGDRVRLEVRLAPGARLELVEVAGTVAYPGPPAGWHVRLELAEGAELIFAGKPFVVAGGASVERTVNADLAAGARLRLHETLVLGRHGEAGGDGVSRTSIMIDSRPVLVEDQNLDPRIRARPGVLGDHRVIDSVLSVGLPPPAVPGATRLLLPGPGAALTRWLGADAATSPLSRPPHPPAPESTPSSLSNTPQGTRTPCTRGVRAGERATPWT